MDSSSFTELSQRRPVHFPIVLICVNRLLVGGRTHGLRIMRASIDVASGILRRREPHRQPRQPATPPLFALISRHV